MAEYRRFPYGIGGDDSEPVSIAEFQLSAGRYHYQLVWCQNNNNRAGHVCPYFFVRKSIMYYLKTQTLMFGLFFFFTFYHGSLLPVFPDLAT